MVASEHEDGLPQLYFYRQNEPEDFDRETASVDVVSQEDVLCCFKRPSRIVINDLDEVVELPVDISHNGDRVHNFDDVGLLF